MPKSSKKEPANAAKSATNNPDAQPPAGNAVPPPPTKRASGTKATGRKTSAAKKKSTAGTPRKRAGRQGKQSPATREPSDADIRLRAYFIAERRVQLALQGDPAHDWIEARRQLIEEAGKSDS